jgi:hypothetical protein
VVLKSGLLKKDNLIMNYRSKVLIYSHRSLIVVDNVSRTIDRELPHCIHHDVEDMHVHNNHYLVSWANKTIYYDEFKGETVTNIFNINLETHVNLMRIEGGFIFAIADG